MTLIKDFQHVTTTVRDEKESLWFYQDLLGIMRAGRLYYRDNRDFIIDFMDLGNGYLLELFYFRKGLIKPTERSMNEKQVGMRHIAFKVKSVDKITEKLKKNKVEFTMEPTDAFGDVRIAFFKDPSGTVIEVVEGDLNYSVKGDVAGYRNLPVGDGLIYDHLALTVENIKASHNFYRNMLGFPHLGRLVFNNDEGFEIDYYQAGKAVIELFSYTKTKTIPYKRNPDDTHLGLRHYGFLVEKVDPVANALKAQNVPIMNPPVDALGGVRTCFFADPDGNALELIDGTCVYDE